MNLFRSSVKQKPIEANARVQQWEDLMWKFQASLAGCTSRREMDADGPNFQIGKRELTSAMPSVEFTERRKY